jgi:hypothetical protein
MRRLGIFLPLLAAGACTTFTSKDNVLITSEPPGAHITIDGIETGFTTPKAIPIGGLFGYDHDVVLTKKGYRPTSVRVYQHTEGYTSKWIDGAYHLTMPPLPLFWTFGDFFFPFGVRAAIIPGELHAKLYREDEPKIGFEVLAERAQTVPPPTAGERK